MFTGIVEETGTVKSITQNGSSLTLTVSCSFASELTQGESVAVNGTCLTVTSFNSSSFAADVTPESFRRTSLGNLDPGSPVNLERAMKADGRFGGHIVSGHVDGTGHFLSAVKEENAVNITISVNSELGAFIIEKGSVTIDGISLTVAGVSSEGNSTFFTVAVIPHTWNNTTLSLLQEGSSVNIECDIVGKYIRHFLSTDNSNMYSGRQNLQGYPQNSISQDSLLDLTTNFTSFH